MRKLTYILTSLLLLVVFKASAYSDIDFFTQQEIMPFGYNLFQGQFANEDKKEAINPDYKVVPGDKIDVKVWGAKDLQTLSEVDGQGNIFIPEVGPIPVQGVEQSRLNSVVKGKVNNVFKDNVQVYTNLRSSLPVSIFVTGAVISPGRYVGVSTDSALDYLDLAGGIDSSRGSYRNIDIIRKNKVVERVDIYDFLLNGKISQLQLREGDTILVNERGMSVTVKGDVKNEYSFEFKTDWTSGAELKNLASPDATATHVVLAGSRNGKPFKNFMGLPEFLGATLQDGDDVVFQSGLRSDSISITIGGEHLGLETMVVPKNAGLKEVLNHVQVDNLISDVGSIFIRRKSIAYKQREAIEESLRRLQESLLLARSSGSADKSSSISEGEVALLNSFIQQAKLVSPQGKVIVATEKGLSNVPLEEGDVIIVPKYTNIVMINGEVLMPKAIAWDESLSAKDYIQKSGGFTDQANESDIVVLRQNGETFIGASTDVKPGDEIIVLPEVKINNLDLAQKVVDVIFKIAVAAAIPFNINN